MLFNHDVLEPADVRGLRSSQALLERRVSPFRNFLLQNARMVVGVVTTVVKADIMVSFIGPAHLPSLAYPAR